MQGSEDRPNILHKLAAFAKVIKVILHNGIWKPHIRADYPQWEDFRIASQQTRIGVVAPTVETGFRGDANSIAVNFVHNQADEVQFDIQMPHGWKEGGSLYPHVHFSPWTTGTGAVRFILAYRWADINGQFAASESTYQMDATVSTNKQWYHLLADNATALTVDKKISSMLKCRLYRDNTVGSNLAAKVTFLEFDIHFEHESLGTINITSKP